MHFHVTEEDHIRTSDEPGRTETDGNSFASERELQELASDWPMKRLVEIWNRLPGVQPVTRFTDRKTAVARIWRAIQPQTERPATKTVQRISKNRPVFREGIESGTGLQFVIAAARRHPERDLERNRMASSYGARVHLAQSVEAGPQSALL